MGIQLVHQPLTISKELRRSKVAVLPIAFLMQALHRLECVAQITQVLLHHHRTHAEPG